MKDLRGGIGREKTMEFCCRAIDICDEFWMFGISRGTLLELCHVLQHHPNKKINLLLDEFDPGWKTEYEKLKNEFGDPLSKIKPF